MNVESVHIEYHDSPRATSNSAVPNTTVICLQSGRCFGPEYLRYKHDPFLIIGRDAQMGYWGYNRHDNLGESRPQLGSI